VATVGVVWLLARYGWRPFAAAGVVVALGLAVWSYGHRDTFDRYARLPARGWRRRLRYRRRWQPATSTAGLTIRGRHEHLPDLLGVRSTDEVDLVRVRMLPGQTLIDWSAAGERLAQSFGVLDVRARPIPGRPHEIDLLALVVDPLVEPVPLPEPADPVDLAAIPVGLQEDGQPLVLPLWRPGRGSTHLLVAGVTGAGKGSAVWSLLAGLGPAIRSGLVRVWAVDPKGGAELGGGRPLFDRFVRGGQTAGGAPWQTAIADLLDEAVAAMQARLVAMENPRRPGGPVRWHTPTEAEPAIVVIIDEVGSLTAWGVPADLRRRIEGALSLLLSQGRAAAVSVVVATQDPRKETLTFRDLIPVRLALRTVEPVADLILGAGMRARGARTDRIAPELPGVVYLLPEGASEPVRGRLAYVDDDTLQRIAGEYAYRPEPVLAEPLVFTPSMRVVS
jgi:S-DNA-T family DNA segregation ATPase FtsK/SpoIIIE